MARGHAPTRMQRCRIRTREGGTVDEVLLPFIACPRCLVPVRFAVGPRGPNLPECRGE